MATRTLASCFSIAMTVAASMASAACLATGEAGPGAATAVAPDATHVSWDLRMPKDAPVVVNGVVSFDTAGTGGGSMLYAGGIAGLLVGIAVHGAIESAAKKEQKVKLQEAANQVLAPYRDVLDGFRNRALMQDAMAKQPFGDDKKLVEDAQGAGSDWIVDTAPTFLITQDQHAFIIDNAITVYAPSAPKVPVYQNIVHAVSRARPGDTAAFWLENQGLQLKQEFADLYAMSIDVALLAIADGPKDNGSPFRTIR